MDRRSGIGGWLAENMVVLNYTHLHGFTRFYTKFLMGIHRRGAETPRGADVGECGRKVGRGWEKAGGNWKTNRLFPRFPALFDVSD